ncbi:MAG: carboxypeptidase-like regulatory domain-containing protein [Bacteroidales bacterium]|nr:carboxypeptidase-like regulatory domain-containing protein [Bacteroidales bacterium]
MKNLKLTAMVIFGFCMNSFSQNIGEIKGTVYDSATNETVPGIIVYVKVGENLIGTNSDANGNFTLKPLNSGNYDVIFSYQGKIRCTLYSVRVNTDKITFLNNIKINPYLELTPVKIVWVDPLINPEDPGIIPIPNKLTKNLPEPKNIGKIIQIMIPDAFVKENGEIFFRGSRSGDAAYYVDGVRTIEDKINLPASAIGNIAVYTGGVPAKYGDFTGAVVSIETKSYFDSYK